MGNRELGMVDEEDKTFHILHEKQGIVKICLISYVTILKCLSNIRVFTDVVSWHTVVNITVVN